MEGLAQTMAGPAAGSQMQQTEVSLEEVVALLMQGIPPEELVKMGVPEEVIMQAITLLEQQMAAEQAAAQQGPQGLAGSMIGV